MCCDFVSLVLQGAGGGIAATATDRQAGNAGRWIMVAGLSGQVLSLMLFMVLWLDFAVKVSKTREEMREAKFANLRALFKFKAFQCGESISAMCTCSNWYWRANIAFVF